MQYDWNKKDYGGQDFVKQMNFKSDLKGRVGLQDITVSSVIRWSWCDQKIRHYTVVLVDSRRCVTSRRGVQWSGWVGELDWRPLGRRDQANPVLYGRAVSARLPGCVGQLRRSWHRRTSTRRDTVLGPHERHRLRRDIPLWRHHPVPTGDVVCTARYGQRIVRYGNVRKGTGAGGKPGGTRFSKRPEVFLNCYYAFLRIF